MMGMLGIHDIFAGVLSNPWLVVFFLGMAPFSEARGAILYGRLIGLDSMNLFIVSVAANILIIPFIWHIVNSRLMGTITHILGGGTQRLIYANRDKFASHHATAVSVFIITPIFGGVWTGVILANLIGLKSSNAFVLMSLGVAFAAGLVLIGVDVVAFALSAFLKA